MILKEKEASKLFSCTLDVCYLKITNIYIGKTWKVHKKGDNGNPQFLLF